MIGGYLRWRCLADPKKLRLPPKWRISPGRSSVISVKLPWHSVIPGATLATAMWFSSTLLFGFYLKHYADYSIIYGSLGAAIALLVWMYMVSLVVLVGAEFNAMLFPRAMLGKELTAVNGPKAAN